MLLTILVAVVVFILLWWVISILPLPATFPAAARSIMYVALIIVAIIWLVRFSGVL